MEEDAVDADVPMGTDTPIVAPAGAGPPGVRAAVAMAALTTATTGASIAAAGSAANLLAQNVLYAAVARI